MGRFKSYFVRFILFLVTKKSKAIYFTSNHDLPRLYAALLPQRVPSRIADPPQPQVARTIGPNLTAMSSVFSAMRQEQLHLFFILRSVSGFISQVFFVYNSFPTIAHSTALLQYNTKQHLWLSFDLQWLLLID